MDRKIVFHITREVASISLFLKQEKIPQHTRARLKRNINDICLNGVPTMLYPPLKVGDELSVMIREGDREEENIQPVKAKEPLPIIFEDDDLLVIDKPSGLPIHPSLGHYNDSLANWLMDYYREEESPFVFRCVNRLDKETSGLTLIAKNPYSGSLLSVMASEKKIERTYLALVSGQIREPGFVDAPIGREDESVILRCVREDGQEAKTWYEPVEIGKAYTLVRLRLGTGRCHQIRVHMKYIGHPLPGDYLYYPEDTVIDRVPLHSAGISFLHPITKEKLCFQSRCPKEFYTVLRDIKDK